ncbi:MAG: flagellar biosynthesis protein FlgA [Syntrophus sp. (in: bacteria)]|nr:flagellar biosynthesis protein FlgA [Syntrophus sp. (in: bacteria)]
MREAAIAGQEHHGVKKRMRPAHGALTTALVMAVIMLCGVANVQAARIKDISGIGGVRQNQLIGYGLVVGLMGTGDDVKNGFTRETIASMLSRQGLSMRDRQPKAKNIAAVMLTAQLPAFAKTGSRIDVTVSSIGDATSLQGGTLLMTPLRAGDGEVYAVAQGALVLGGFSAGGASASVTKNQTNVAIITNGAIVEREVNYAFGLDKKFSILLFQPDFTTATKLAATVAGLISNAEVKAIDSGTIVVRLDHAFTGNMTEVISFVENIDVVVDASAVVVMNEKTGTVVMGENVRISTVAVAHGNLSIQIKETLNVSQPLPFAPRPPDGAKPVADRKDGTIVAPGGQTVVTKDTAVAVQEEKKQIMVVPRGVTIQEVVQALNAIGVTPRDLITIIQTIKAAGALQADLRII